MAAQTFTLPELPYSYDALEPVISKEIMTLHHDKHHRAYVDNLNKAFVQLEEAEKKQDISEAIALQSAIKFNGGGHINHSIFWTNLAPKNQGGGTPSNGALTGAIAKEFGSLEKLVEALSAKAVAIQGSGWAWLGVNKKNGRLELATCENQDPLITKGLVPLLGIDVWEHAYYPQYKNVRAKYVESIWQVVNWKNVEERYTAAIK